jgi:hypothetical protein
MFASVGPDFEWQDRQVNPNRPESDGFYTGAIDLAYDEYGIRSFVTLFAGGGNTPADKPSFVDRIAQLGRGREHKIFAYEISNEGQGVSGHAEQRELGRRLQSQVPNLVALGTADDETACELYADAGVTAATMHYARDFGGDDVTVDGQTYHMRPVRQPWGWPGEYDASCTGKMPKIVFHNEGIGIQSSGNMDDLPVDIALAYITTFIAQNSGYLFHTGAGIRGGGQGDVAPITPKPWAPRKANLWEQPTFAACCDAVRAARAALPPGLANWEKANAGWTTAPYDGFADHADKGRIVRAYSSLQGPENWTVVLGIRQSVTQAPKRAMALDILDPLTCEVVRHLELAAGEPFTLDPCAGLLLHGVWR